MRGLACRGGKVFNKTHFFARLRRVEGIATRQGAGMKHSAISENRRSCIIVINKPTRFACYGRFCLRRSPSVKVSRMDQHQQRAAAHLKGRLKKERGTLDARKKSVSNILGACEALTALVTHTLTSESLNLPRAGLEQVVSLQCAVEAFCCSPTNGWEHATVVQSEPDYTRQSTNALPRASPTDICRVVV